VYGSLLGQVLLFRTLREAILKRFVLATRFGSGLGTPSGPFEHRQRGLVFDGSVIAVAGRSVRDWPEPVGLGRSFVLSGSLGGGLNSSFVGSYWGFTESSCCGDFR